MPSQQSLPPQDLVAAGDAAVEIVGDVEEGAVAIGDAGIERQQIGRQRGLAARGAAPLELLDRARRPYRPVAEQAAAEIGARGDALVAQVERQRQIEQDVVVVAGIERDAVERAGSGDAAQHVERAIAVERRDLDGDDIVDRGKAPPEIRAQDHAADRRLQIEADQRNFARDRLAMGDDLVLAGRFHRGEAEQPGMIADAARDLGFRDRLPGRAGKAGDQRQRPLRSSLPPSRRPAPAPAGTARRRGSRIAWCGRRPRARRRRRRCNSASARADARCRACGRRRAPADARG